MGCFCLERIRLTRSGLSIFSHCCFCCRMVNQKCCVFVWKSTNWPIKLRGVVRRRKDARQRSLWEPVGEVRGNRTSGVVRVT